ncbi:NAD(P)H-hydrate epimerase [Helcococcus kunzii]|uniref:NAD(P)H-hydrate epimerase n=1 Tax=Helcococcus kunzii TaxID=40091 RepID=UPI0038A569C6
MDIILRDDYAKLLKYNLEELKIPYDIIIENAAIKILKHIDLSIRETFAIISGITENGAIGLACARILKSEKKYVEVYIVDNKEQATEQFKKQLELVKNLEIKISYLETLEELQNLSSDLNRVNTIIDAISGREFEANFKGTTEYIIDCINKSRIYAISVDLPTGMDYDTGKTHFLRVDSDLVVTFHKIKKGLIDNSRFDVVVEKIGLFERGRNVRHKTY